MEILLSEEEFVRHLEEFLEFFVKKHHIPFRRENTKDFAARLMKIFTLFTLPSVPDYLLIDAMKVKCLYALWNSVLDDRIDCDHDGKEDLIDTINVLHEWFSEERIHAKTATGKVMRNLLQRFVRFPLGHNRDIAKEFLFLDLLQTTNAFNYERIVLATNGFIALTEYLEFSTSTISAMCMLDIDLALMQKEVSPTTIGKLREVYKILGKTFRLFNDVITFEREFSSERSLNSLILQGIEKGILPSNILKLPKREKKKIQKENLSLIIEEVMAKIDSYKQLTASKISQITEMNLEPIVRSLDLIVERASSDGFVTDK